jgi:cyanate lyase
VIKAIIKTLFDCQVWLTSAIYGQHPFDEKDAQNVLKMVGINDIKEMQILINAMKQMPQIRGDNDSHRYDPVISRLYEIVRIYGPTFKALVNEMCGDGIMSAIDCNVNCDHYLDQSSNQRIVITIDGKFLKYKF